MNTNAESRPAMVPDHAWLPKLIASSAAAGLGVALLAALTGCVGYVDGGYYGGSAVVVPGPDVYFYGGGYERVDIEVQDLAGSAQLSGVRDSIPKWQVAGVVGALA